MDWTYSFNHSDPSLIVGIAHRNDRYITRIVAAGVKVQASGSDLDEVLGQVKRMAVARGYQENLAEAIEEARSGIPGQAPHITASEPQPQARPPLPLPW